MTVVVGKLKRCKRCGYEWVTRIAGRPKACPRCKQPRWDVPARKPAGKVK